MIFDRRRSRGGGFSMLELLIVLAIMVGVAALTFPRLTRPLAESDAHQAANDLRDAITECRQSAALSGQPLFMRLESLQSEVEWGGWTELLASQFGSADQGWQPEPESESSTEDVLGRGLSAYPTGLKSARLPHGVVIESVHWISNVFADDPMSRMASTDGDPAAVTDAAEDRSEEERFSELIGSDDATGVDVASEAASAVDGERWFLPFLPSGRTRDCVIVLRDPLSGGRVGLELDSVTGMTRVRRLASSDRR